VTDWADVVLTLGVGALGGLLGAAGAIGAVVVQSRFARHDRQVAERSERVKNGAAALAPITTLLANLEPDRITVSASESLLQELRDHRARWEASIREPLAAFALAHPSRDVGDLATKLDVHVEWVLIRGVSLAEDARKPRRGVG
jgi:hypothetical protein